MYRNVLALALLLCISGSAFAASKTFTGTGNFDDAARWSGGTVPSATEDLIIQGSCTFNLNAGTTPTAATVFGNLTMDPTGTLTFSETTPHSLKVVNISATGGTITLGTGHIQVRGSFNPTNLTFSAGTGTIEYFVSAPSPQTVAALPYYTLLLTGTRGTNNLTLGAGVVEVSNDLDLTGLTFSTGQIVGATGNEFLLTGSNAETVPPGDYDILSIAGTRGGNPVDLANGVIAIRGALNVVGVMVVAQSANTVAYTGDGTLPQMITPLPYTNLTIADRMGSVNFPPAPVGVAGVLALGSPNTLYPNPASIVFNGSGAQSVPTQPGFIYGNLDISTTGNVTLAGNYEVVGNFSAAPTATINPGASSFLFNSLTPQSILGGTFHDLIIAGNNRMSVSLDGDLSIINSFTIPATFAPMEGVFALPTSTVTFDGTVNQFVPSVVYNNLVITDGSVRTVTFDPQIFIGGTFTPENVGLNIAYSTAGINFTFIGGPAQDIPPIPAAPYDNLTVNGNCMISAAVTTSNLTITPSGALAIAPATLVTVSSSTAVSGQLSLNGSGSQLSTSTLDLDGTSTVSVNFMAQINADDVTTAVGSIFQHNGDLMLAGSTASSFSGTLSGTGDIFKNGTGGITVTAANPGFMGELSINVGTNPVTLNVANALGSGGTAGDINANNGTLVINSFALPNLVQAAGGTVRGLGASGCKVQVAVGSTVFFETMIGSDALSVLLMSAPGGGNNATFNGPGRLILLDNTAPATYYDGFFNLGNGMNVGNVQLNSSAALGLNTNTVFVNPGFKLMSNTPQPILQGIVMVGGELGATGADDRIFAGPISVSGAATLQLRDILNPAQARNVEIAGFIGGPGLLTISGPPASTPKLKLTGMMSSQANIGPSAEVEVAPMGSMIGSLLNVGTGGILTTTTNGNVAVSVNLATGAILRGTGGFQDMSSVTSVGGVLEPGPLAGTGLLELTSGMGSPSNLTLDAASVIGFDLSTPGSSDMIQVSGTLVLDGSLVIKPVSTLTPGTYTLFTHGGLTNNDVNLPPAPAGFTFALDTTTASNEVRLIVGAQPLVFTNPSSATVEVGATFTFPITVSGPSSPTVTVTNTALPPGIRRNGLQLEGTPTQAGPYTVTLTASNGLTSATQTVTITVNQPVISSTFGPFTAEGKVGTSFFLDLTTLVTGTITGVSTTDVLPSGLTLSGTVISGLPKTAGTSTVNVALTFANGTGTAAIQFTILAKTETLGPVLSDLLFDPEQPGIENILMSVSATHPQNLPVTVTWDFGDGTTGSKDTVIKKYTAGNTYTITVTATAGGKSTTLTKALIVSDIDPDAPVITTATANPTPSLVGQSVTFTASTTDVNGDAVTLNWDFGDGTNTATGSSVTFAYALAGEYSVSVVATDATGKTSRTNRFKHYVSQAAAIQTAVLAPVPVPSNTILPGGTVVLGLDSTDLFEGTGDEVEVTDENGKKRKRRRRAIIRLRVTDAGAAFSRADMEVDTDFGIPGRRAVKGSSPSAEFDKPMLAVAKSTSREKATRKETGKARKTIPISARDIAKTPVVEKEPSDTKMNGLKLKGDFFPSRSANTGSQSREGAGSRATKADVLDSDKVTATGSIMMPGGLDMSEGTEVQVALGNIVDKIVIDAKGRGKGKFTSLQMRIKTDKTTKKTVADVAAKFTIKMSVAEMVDNGFDTEGVVVSKEQAGAELNIQCAMMIGEVTYAINNPVTLKVAPKEDKASMVTRKVKAE